MTRPRHSLRALALATLAVCAAIPAAAVGQDTKPAVGVVQLSNENTVTFWAHSAGDAVVHAIPTVRGQQIARLHLLTEDGAAEVYIILRKYVDQAGRTWLRVRIPRRPNGFSGWVLARGLGPAHKISTRLVIDRTRLKATLYDAGRAVWSSPVGVGKRSTPTPKGNFWVREKLVALGGSNPIYGPYALGTSAYSVLTEWPGGGVVGIHGTNQPELIPGRPSHGCIRMPNAAITQLYHLISVGTPVSII